MSGVDARPEWATWFQVLGAMTASHPAASVGEESPRIVVSSPTGQFAPWMIASGALGIDPNLVQFDHIVEGGRYATWHSIRQRMADCSFVPGRHEGHFTFAGPSPTTISADIYPVRRLPDTTPQDRDGAPPHHSLSDRLRHLPGLGKSWHIWWARHCISPIVIIGDGRDYLQGQRQELLEEAPHWFSDEARSLLSEESGQTKNPDRMYFHPFMVLSPESGDNRAWLRAMKPRLVIVTSWSAFRRRHPSLFAGAPHIIITNRRVQSSIDAASHLSFNHDAKPWDEGPPPPSGLSVRVFNQQHTLDAGDESDEDESEWEL